MALYHKWGVKTGYTFALQNCFGIIEEFCYKPVNSKVSNKKKYQLVNLIVKMFNKKILEELLSKNRIGMSMWYLKFN